MLFDNLFGLIRVVIVSVGAYVALILVLRLTGKRALSKLNAFDLVVTVALGSILASVLLSKDVAFAEGLLAFTMLAALQWSVSRLSISSALFSRLVRARPTLLVEGGNYREDVMARERITAAEVNAAMRAAGIGRLQDVAAVVLETDGSLSVIRETVGPIDLVSDVER